MATPAMIEPSGNIVKVTSPYSGACCRALCVGTAGTATMTDESGNTLTAYPLQAGYNPIKVKAVTLTGASDVWLLF